MSKIEIKKIGITDLDTDVIVNAANDGLWAGSGVCGAVFKDAGYHKLQEACNKIGHCDTGSAVITPGFNLKAKYIIHAVGPQFIDGNHNEQKLLYSAYQKSLGLAKEYDCHSIGFPLLSAGIFGYPVNEAWETALQACKDFISANPVYDITIVFAVLSDGIMNIGQSILKELGSNKLLTNETILEDSEKTMDSRGYSKAKTTLEKKFENMTPEQRKETIKVISDMMGMPAVNKEKQKQKSSDSGESASLFDLRQERIKVFEDTQKWIESDTDLTNSVILAKKNTKVFYENDYPAFNRPIIDEAITVTGYRSYEAAMKLRKQYPDSRIAVMNFANASHAGGGVTKGAGAQEECLCRTSTLYPLLYRRTLRDTFYKHHKDLNTSKASDALVYTEGVIICKTDEEIPKRMPKEDWVMVDVITIAAPDLREKSNPYAPLVGNGTYMNNAELFGYHVKRAIHMLTVAAAKGADILVLGAFGCGAFQNDPNVVARAYKTALQEFPKVFRRVEFAVYCPPTGSKDYDVFKSVLD